MTPEEYEAESLAFYRLHWRDDSIAAVRAMREIGLMDEEDERLASDPRSMNEVGLLAARLQSMRPVA